MEPVRIIAAAWDLGAPVRGCRDGPERLQALNLCSRLQQQGVPCLWEKMLLPNSTVKRLDELNLQLARETSWRIRQRQPFLVLGGDHSCAIGSWAGVASQLDGHMGLLWIDAHMDAHTPITTPSGATHGMPLAALLGEAGILIPPSTVLPALKPEHLCLFGVHDFEEDEARLLDMLGVRVITTTEIKNRGMDECMHEAIEHVAGGTAGYGISIDLDVFDPQYAPGVTTPSKGGLEPTAVIQSLQRHAIVPGFVGLEIAEFNPQFDEQDKTAEIVIELSSTIFSSQESPHDSTEHNTGRALLRA